MEAPEKVYIDDFGSGFSHGWHTEHSYEKDIEYICKDAFIEKLCTWIKENSEKYIECEDHFYAGWLTEDFYKELRKAMEE